MKNTNEYSTVTKYELFYAIAAAELTKNDKDKSLLGAALEKTSQNEQKHNSLQSHVSLDRAQKKAYKRLVDH